MLNKQLFILIGLLLLNVEAAPKLFKRADEKHGKHWGYRNQDKSLLPKDWYKTHANCHGKQQSPINIMFDETKYDSTLGPVQISEKEQIAGGKQLWSIKNNGHSVVLTPKTSTFTSLISPDNEEYELMQMHFHWRSSEHLINGNKYAAELHLVHKNKANPDKFAVLGFLFVTSDQDNEQLTPIIDQLGNVVTFNSEVRSANINLQSIVPFTLNNYYRYSGSLTTPTCDEIVEWFVMDIPLTISDDQILDFQELQDNHGHPILTNSRPIQDIHDRDVKRSFRSKSTKAQGLFSFSSSATTTSFSSGLFVNLLLLLLSAKALLF